MELKQNLIPISKKIRYFIYIIELFCLLNLDQGGISASTKEIKSYFKMTDRELGSFGGISFLGTTLGGIFSLSVINKINRRYLIIMFLITIIISLYFPIIISSKIILLLCRIITGFSQSLMSIYLPVWVDQFGIYDKKSIMMSIITIPSAFGYLIGYISAVLSSWRTTFFINISISFSLLICFFFSKNLYFSKSIVPKKKGLKKDNDKNIQVDNISLFEDAAVDNDKYGKQSIFNNAKNCFKSKLFCFSTISLISILLILSGLQFWINDFLENAIHILDKKERLIYFIVIILITMIGAPMTGGFIMQKLGGYDSIKSIYLPFYCCIISLICSNLLLIFSFKYIVAVLMCGYLFSGCIMISSLNGIIVSSIPKEFAGSASSISNLLYNICGRLVGPSFYGFMRGFFGIESKLPMIILLDIKFITLICLYNCFKYKKQVS
jgi:MFS family permease